MVGTVMWFKPIAGYGFICSNNTKYFVFYKDIEMDGYKKLAQGQQVTFQVKKYKNYKQAANVKII